MVAHRLQSQSQPDAHSIHTPIELCGVASKRHVSVTPPLQITLPLFGDVRGRTPPNPHTFPLTERIVLTGISNGYSIVSGWMKEIWMSDFICSASHTLKHLEEPE
jgi:hypothetical protein